MNPLLYARKKAGFKTQRELADVANLWQNQISRIEKGRPAPRKVAIELMKHVGDHISILDLFYPDNFSPPKQGRRRKEAA